MKKELIIGIGIFLLILSILFDNQIASSIINYRLNFLTSAMHLISFLGSAFIAAVLSTLLFGFDKRSRRYIPALLLTLASALIISTALKYFISRPRPVISPLEINHSYSFPSSHAAAVFAPLVLIDKLFPKLKWVWLGLGILVLFSRIYLGVHYMSDVIGGALIGYLAGIIILRLTKVNF